MGNLKINGIIIGEHNYGDFDKMLTMLTPGFGKISCIAKGARRQKSALLAGTQFLAFGEYMVFKGGNTYNINSCELIEIFYNIRTDLDKLKYASHIIKIIQDVTEENQNCYKILQLLLNTLYMISETDKNLDLIVSVFKLRLLCILGFTPKIKKCAGCDSEDVSYFSIKDNGFKCEACSRQDTSSIKMQEATKVAFKYIIMAPPKKIFSFDLKGDSLEELKLIVKIYFNEKLEKDYKIEELF